MLTIDLCRCLCNLSDAIKSPIASERQDSYAMHDRFPHNQENVRAFVD